MIGTIGFDHYSIECIIGVNPEERLSPQKIYVDFRAEHDFSQCVAADDVQYTIDYSLAAELCKQVAKKGEYFLLETLANAILQEMAERFGIVRAWIKIKKPSPFNHVDWAIVELEYGNRRRKE